MGRRLRADGAGLLLIRACRSPWLGAGPAVPCSRVLSAVLQAGNKVTALDSLVSLLTGRSRVHCVSKSSGSPVCSSHARTPQEHLNTASLLALPHSRPISTLLTAWCFRATKVMLSFRHLKTGRGSCPAEPDTFPAWGVSCASFLLCPQPRTSHFCQVLQPFQKPAILETSHTPFLGFALALYCCRCDPGAHSLCGRALFFFSIS